MVWYIIPARRGSKGFPFKARTLIEYALKNFPKEIDSNIILTTDDEYIIDRVKDRDFNILIRDPAKAADTTSMKEVMLDVIDKFEIDSDDDIVLLYLTYPERKFNDIQEAYKYYIDNNYLSILGKKEPKTHPYLCLFETGDKGKQLIDHDLYRRQDYPKCFELSHSICIFKVSEIDKLNNQLYYDDTVFYQTPDFIDVDYKKDLEEVK